MNEVSFQVHYQYLLSQLWINEAKTSWAIKTNNMSKTTTLGQAENEELRKQMRNLQNMYPEYYANWLKEHEMRERKTRTNVV